MALFSAIKPGDMMHSNSATAAPGWLGPCFNQTVSRTDYADLFAKIGIKYGPGDGSTTFHLPMQDGSAMRGDSRTPSASSGLPNITGSGTASSNTATFANHGLFVGSTYIPGVIYRAKMVGGALSGLTLNNDYWITPVDANTFKFSTSLSNASATNASPSVVPSYVTITGANTAVFQLYPDADLDARIAMIAGGATSGVGSYQLDQVKNHQHPVTASGNAAGGGGGYYTSAGFTVAANTAASYGGNETRMRNVSMNWFIKT